MSGINMLNITMLEDWGGENHAQNRAMMEGVCILGSEIGEGGFEMAVVGRDDIKEIKPNRFNTLIVNSELSGVRAVPFMRKPRVRKGDLGKLYRMLDLPVEVFCHIASYMEPLDLLYLARTSRELRRFLMSKSSKLVWNASILAIGMPPCPSDLSAPQYANLLFEKDCHGCGRTRSTHTMLTLRIRLCNDCSPYNVIPGKRLAEEAFGIEVSRIQEIYSLLPWSCMPIYGDEMPTLDFSNAHGSLSFLRYDFLRVVSDYLRTEPNSEERKAFVREQRHLIEELAKNVRAISEWERKRRTDREEADEALRTKRKEQVEERLQLLGYSKSELEAMPFLFYLLPADEKQLTRAWQRLMGQPKELTERGWKSLRPKLEEILQEKRRLQRARLLKINKEKRRNEFFVRYKSYAFLHRLGQNVVTLCFVDLCEVPLVAKLMEEDDYSIELTTSRWAVIHDQLPRLIQDHYEKIQRDCGALLVIALWKAARESSLQGWLLNVENKPEILSRAYAFFGMYRELQTPSTFYDVVLLRHRRLFDTKDWDPWDPSRIQIEVLITQAACVLLTSLGMSEDTTMECMEELGMTLVCNQCDPFSRCRMSWGFLVSHLCSEVKKFREKELLCQEKGIPWRESHKVTFDGSVLAFYDPNFSPPRVGWSSRIVEPTHSYCRDCLRLNIKTSFRYEETYEAHMQTYHGFLM